MDMIGASGHIHIFATQKEVNLVDATRMKIYVIAYMTQMSQGKTMDELDKMYLDLGRLTEKEIKEIHKQL